MESGNAYAIYQLKDGDELRGLRFEAYERAKDAIDKANYQIVYSGTLPEGNTLPQRLDALYRQFNIDRPSDFHGHSLSVSDVIVIRQNGTFSAYYVDSIGFVELPGFCSGKTRFVPWKTVSSRTTTSWTGSSTICQVNPYRKNAKPFRNGSRQGVKRCVISPSPKRKRP